MYEKVDPGHQPATATDEQPKDMACTCTCSCSCNCATSDQASTESGRLQRSMPNDMQIEAITPT